MGRGDVVIIVGLVLGLAVLVTEAGDDMGVVGLILGPMVLVSEALMYRRLGGLSVGKGWGTSLAANLLGAPVGAVAGGVLVVLAGSSPAVDALLPGTTAVLLVAAAVVSLPLKVLTVWLLNRRCPQRQRLLAIAAIGSAIFWIVLVVLCGGDRVMLP